MSVTFPVCDVLTSVEPFIAREGSAWFSSTTPIYGFSTDSEALVSSGGHGLIQALSMAFSYHYPVSLSPDHIWLLICQGFVKHVSLNTEELRHQFVSHQGKKELRVFTLPAPGNELWIEITRLLAEKIRAEVGDELYTLFSPRFSTTTPTITTAFHIGLMDAMKGYFDYYASMCGIPSITLEGTLDDWKQIREAVGFFRQYDLDWWIDAIEPILDECIHVFEGRRNADFWKNIYHVRSESGYEGIDGWIGLFFPYHEIYQRELDGYTQEQIIQILNSDDRKDRALANTVTRHRVWNRNPNLQKSLTDTMSLPLISSHAGISSVVLKTDDQDFMLHAGFLGVSQDDATLALRPDIGWFVTEEIYDNLLYFLNEGTTQKMLDEAAENSRRYAEQQAQRQSEPAKVTAGGGSLLKNLGGAKKGTTSGLLSMPPKRPPADKD